MPEADIVKITVAFILNPDLNDIKHEYKYFYTKVFTRLVELN
jgi:hypothetical protein